MGNLIMKYCALVLSVAVMVGYKIYGKKADITSALTCGDQTNNLCLVKRGERSSLAQ